MIRSHQVVLITRVVSTSLLELQKVKLKSSGPRSGTSVISLTKTLLKKLQFKSFGPVFHSDVTIKTKLPVKKTTSDQRATEE